MKTKYVPYLRITLIILAFWNGMETSAQTLIRPGEVSGTWTRKGSPYMISGDINIPLGKTLNIQPGVKVSFKGSYVLNVQGSIIATGTENDSIVFTIADTLGYQNNSKIGWNGIHFDPRPIRWDTVRMSIPGDEEAKLITTELFNQGSDGSSTQIVLSLQIPDLVNDQTFITPVSKVRQSSKLSFCLFEFGTMGEKQRPYIFGGAIYIYRYSNLVISNSVFENNRSYAGGAVYCKEAAPVLIDNIFENCKAISSGGAMVFIHSGPILAGNRVTGNTSGHNGGAILFYESCPYVLNNTFLCNKASNAGGALYIERKTSRIITLGDYSLNENTRVIQDLSTMNTDLDNSVIKNTASSNGRFINNLICNNFALSGGGAGLYATAPEFTNNTICNNKSRSSGGGMSFFYASPTVVNSIIYGNKSEESEGQQMYFIGRNKLKISYSNIEAGISGLGKDSTCELSLDYYYLQNDLPLFSDPDEYDYSLQTGSPCIDAGNPDTLSLQLSSYDLYNKNRINNSKIDFGAIEYTGSGKNELKGTNETEQYFEGNKPAEEAIFNVFPNPSNGKFSIIIYNNPYQRIRITVFNRLGTRVYDKEIATESMAEETVEMEGNVPGIYLVQISSDTGIIYKDEVIIE